MVRANELTATHALRLMRTGDLSAEGLAQACLERVRERDAAVRGWAHLDPELVLRNARELDKREVKGPLHGIPIAVKDVILTEDMPTEHNSPLYKGSFPTLIPAARQAAPPAVRPPSSPISRRRSLLARKPPARRSDPVRSAGSTR